jgi:hypothetical protein
MVRASHIVLLLTTFGLVHCVNRTGAGQTLAGLGAERKGPDVVRHDARPAESLDMNAVRTPAAKSVARQGAGADAERRSRALMDYVKHNIKTPCSLAEFGRDLYFREVLSGDANLGLVIWDPNVEGLSLQAGQSMFVLQPDYMVECGAAIYFVVKPEVGSSDLLETLKEKPMPDWLVTQLVISPGELGDL